MAETLLQQMIANGGLRKAFKACTYLASWRVCQQAIGHDPTWAEYCEYWRQSESTTAREVRAFHACLGPDAKVSAVWDQIGPVVAATGAVEAMVGAVATAPEVAV